MRVASLVVLVCVVLLCVSSAEATRRLRNKLAAATLQPRSAVRGDPSGNQCLFQGETQQCSDWCSITCGAPCSTCESAEAGAAVDCVCDDIPAINTYLANRAYLKHYARLGYTCHYLGTTQDCSTWCTDQCSAPCTSCLAGSGSECMCDELPAITYQLYDPIIAEEKAEEAAAAAAAEEADADDTTETKKAIKIKSDPTGNQCVHEGVTWACSEWCSQTCSGPCSTCEAAAAGEAVTCACDDVPAINDIALKSDPTGNQCVHEGVTWACSEWCSQTCSGPCSTCEAAAAGEAVTCACDDVPAINDIAIKSDPTGNQCVHEGVTWACSEWCSQTCSGPCSTCESAVAGDAVTCACDDVPAINDIALKSDPTGNQCVHEGVTWACSEWCSQTCSGPCSTCEAAAAGEAVTCACDDVPAINDKKKH